MLLLVLAFCKMVKFFLRTSDNQCTSSLLKYGVTIILKRSVEGDKYGDGIIFKHGSGNKDWSNYESDFYQFLDFQVLR